MADADLPVIASFEVRRRGYLAPGRHRPRHSCRISPPTSSAAGPLYRAMVLTRTFDLKAVSLQRTGRLGTYAVSLGQEAVSVGVASAMRQEDVLLPSYRDNGALLWRGVKMEEILLYWGGDERGNRSSGPGPRLSLLRSGRLAGAACRRRRLCLQVAQGAARRRLPLRRRRHLQGRCLRGDEFRRRPEAARRVRRQQQPVGHLGAAQAADRVRDAGAEGDRRGLFGRAGRRQRRDRGARGRRPRRSATPAPAQGPRLIEALTYRLGDHTTADDAARYRPPEEVQARWKEEPIARLGPISSRQKAWGKPRRRRSARLPAAHRGRHRALPGHATARAGDHVRSPLRRAAPGLCRASASELDGSGADA